MTSAIVPTFANSPSWRGIEQHALLVARVDGEGHIHGGEDDGVVEGEEQERGHARGFLRNSCLRIVRKGSSRSLPSQGFGSKDLIWRD